MRTWVGIGLQKIRDKDCDSTDSQLQKVLEFFNLHFIQQVLNKTTLRSILQDKATILTHNQSRSLILLDRELIQIRLRQFQVLLVCQMQ